METDFGLAEFFTSVPNAIKPLIDDCDEVAYRMVAPELKRVDRRLDACFIPIDAPEKPLIAVEFQGYPDKAIYYKALAKGALLGEKFPDLAMKVVICFLDRGLDPKTPYWCELGRSGFAGFQVIYLEEAIARIESQDPSDPTAALLGLLVRTKETVEDEDARRRYRAISESTISREEKQVYVKLLMYWLMQLHSSTEEEMSAMLGMMTPLEETPAFRSIFAKGEAKGKAEGIAEGRAKQLVSQIERLETSYGEGLLSEQAYRVLVAPLRTELEDLRRSLITGQAG